MCVRSSPKRWSGRRENARVECTGEAGTIIYTRWSWPIWGAGVRRWRWCCGFWDRWEPRPPEHEIDADLFALCTWLARIGGLNPADVQKVAQYAGIKRGWPEGSVLRTPEERFATSAGFSV